jgi:two-component system heavy metal sensor histidine kinase CusS
MRSTKLAVSLACLVTAGIGIGVSLGVAWGWLRQTNEYSVHLEPKLIQVSLAATATAFLAVVVPIWLLRRRVNDSVIGLARALEEQRASSCELHAISSSNLDREFKELVAEINALIGAFTETQTRLNQYSVRVAHELRAPITVLQLQLDHAAKTLDPHFFEAMMVQVRRLNEYVDTALYIARVAEQKIRPHKTKRKIADLVQEIAGLYELQATARGRRLCVDLSTGLEADLDEKIFGLILHNLLSNAISHGCGEIRVRLRPGNGAARLLVLNRVSNQTNDGVGTGLGLRTVAILAQAHNLAFRSRRVFNGYAAVVRIPA